MAKGRKKSWHRGPAAGSGFDTHVETVDSPRIEMDCLDCSLKPWFVEEGCVSQIHVQESFGGVVNEDGDTILQCEHRIKDTPYLVWPKFLQN